MLDALIDAVVVADADNRIVYSNPGVEDLLGWQPQDLIGQRAEILVPQRLRQMHSNGVERYLRTGIGHIVGRPTRVPALTRSGEERLIELVLSPLVLTEDRPAVAATLRDVGERVDLERQSAVATHLLGVFGRDLAEPDLIAAVLEALGRSLEMVVAAFWSPSREDQLVCRAIWHAPPAGKRLAAVSGSLPLQRGEGLPGRVWASGSPSWISSLAHDENYPRREDALADGLGSAFAFPVRAQGRIVGVIELYAPEPAEPDESLLALSSLIGRRLGEVMRSANLEDERRRLAEREHDVAAAFRNSLLPRALPRIPGVEIGAAFHPGGESVVGGDFYDVYPVGGGGPDLRWGLTIGDVCGTGAEAAAVTANVRYTGRALIRAGLPLVAVAQHINEALLAGEASRFCTCILGLLEVKTGGALVQLVNGGHVYPICLRAGGGVELISTKGRLLGVLPEVDAVEVQVSMAPGDLLVLYTDGITEARDGDELFGEQRLRDLVASLRHLSAPEAATRIQQAAQTFAGGRIADDMAVLVLGVPGGSDG